MRNLGVQQSRLFYFLADYALYNIYIFVYSQDASKQIVAATTTALQNSRPIKLIIKYDSIYLNYI
jgi:hypothetical protein